MNLGYYIKRFWIRLCRISHRKGYGIHSPFAFNLVTGVIYERAQYYAYGELAEKFAAEARDYPQRDLRLLMRLCNDARPRRGIIICPENQAIPAYLRRGCAACRFTTHAAVPQGDAGSIDWAYVGTDADLADALPRLLTLASDRCVIVIRHICRTPQTAAAWEQLKSDERVRVTFDLYDYGLAYFESRLNKEDYVICY